MNDSLRFIENRFRNFSQLLPPNFLVEQNLAVNSENGDPARRKIMSAMVRPDPEVVATMLKPNPELPDSEQLLYFLDKMATKLKREELEASEIIRTRFQLSKILNSDLKLNF